MSANIIELTDATFDAEVLDADLPVLVDFWAAWCVPCKMVAPVVESLAEEFAGKLKVGKLDVDHHQRAAAQYGIMSIPTLMVFKNGEPVKKIVGFKPKDEMKKLLEPVL